MAVICVRCVSHIFSRPQTDSGMVSNTFSTIFYVGIYELLFHDRAYIVYRRFRENHCALGELAVEGNIPFPGGCRPLGGFVRRSLALDHTATVNARGLLRRGRGGRRCGKTTGFEPQCETATSRNQWLVRLSSDPRST